jgi:formamidopyrimidine-DNA glycosylase
MPEGPEVRRYGQSLAKAVSQKTLQQINVLSGRYTKKMIPGIHDILDDLPAKVTGVGVHGKFLYWMLNNDFYVWNTLGMTGHWSPEKRKHSRVEFCLSDGTKVYFNDQRNFGTLKFVRGRYYLLQKLNSLGPDMLANDVSDDVFIEKLRRKSTWPITKAIMNQSVVSGVGNYVKADALWLSCLSPHRTVDSLTNEDLTLLNKSIKKVLRESYNHGGATIRSYENFDGSLGEYTQRFLVYNQKKDPHGNEVTKEKTADGRTTHWVPSVQR